MSARLSGGMFLRQNTKMHMTPKLRQAIRILQLSAPELWAYVRQELEENPVLEAIDVRWDMMSGAGGARISRDRGLDTLDFAVDRRMTLERHLTEQLRLMKPPSAAIERIVRYIIGNLDTNGYLELPLQDLASTLQAAEEDAEAALRIVQSLEPAGVGARDLKECLLLQLQDLPKIPPLAPRLIHDFLDDIGGYRIHKISKQLGVPRHDVEDAIRVIKKLNPRPGSSYYVDEVKYIVPDVIVEKAGDRFVVSIPDATVPRLEIHPQYERLAEECGKEVSARKFLSAKYRSAAFLIKCIEQRRLTLFRVTEAIVEEQDAFFREGPSRLKPMNLRDIADKLNLHESTVSRATSGKYAQTPWGLFELTYFFPAGYNRGLIDEASAESVKEKIRTWVAGEDAAQPYSDQQLADLLQEEGIPVSRRTVMKYREQLGILSSVRRRNAPR
ncbi:RNA polymerase factor sigma-54 [Cohnella pontilimi]|uniref:RNA polymerase factor sigma-54 n=1 Tax=Cohnella pontilimi TaxID=2564100 RepID=A0A4U0F8L5_9BACL|nr:RNA polymerase factor sigma-54 [Cohnella pontilimi]TJY41076.1 RNA polymerase factor sigma-54 [Cohnella pontilimi]